MSHDSSPAFRDVAPDGASLCPLDARMEEVKLACEAAPTSGKQSASLRYFQSAERARSSGDEAECIRRLAAAEKALA